MRLLLLLMLIGAHAFARAPDMKNLPWINAKDERAIFYARPFLPKKPVIIEAGVADATDTLRMKALWKRAKIYGFEPHPVHYAIAKERLSIYRDVTLRHAALFDHVGQIVFYMSGKNSGASSVLEDNFDQVEKPEDLKNDTENYRDEPIAVECTTLDAWSAENGHPHVDYIWLDCEGAELPILQNGISVLEHVKVISTEVNFKEFRKGMTQFEDLYDFLTESGFELKYIWGRSDWQAVAVFVKRR